MSRRSTPREVIVHCTVTFPDMTAVRDWLSDVGGPVPRSNAAAACRYVETVIVTNSDWDHVPIACSCEALKPTQQPTKGNTHD